MTVQDHLGVERRMAPDLDSDVAPFRIEDMERVVVHIRHRLLYFDVIAGADPPRPAPGHGAPESETSLA